MARRVARSRSVRLLSRPRGGSPQAARPTAPLSEKEAARYAIAHKMAVTLNRLADAAYKLAHPECPSGPKQPDFYDASQLDCINAWVRVRDWVEFFISPHPDSLGWVAAQQPGKAGPLRSLNVPFAVGDPNPVWPVRSTDKRGCLVSFIDNNGSTYGTEFQRFLAPRGLTRYHIGHDCIANHGDIVVAPEAGTVFKINTFVETTDAVWIRTPTGLTLVLGETEPGSPAEFGVSVGTDVQKGQPVARVGTFAFAQAVDMHMIHFEAYAGSHSSYQQWFDGQQAPPGLLNPTAYLQRAACTLPQLAFTQSMSQGKAKVLGRLVMGTNMRH